MLRKVTDTTLSPQFDELFNFLFTLILETGKKTVILIHSYHNIYRRSPTFRRLFNYAVPSLTEKHKIKIASTIQPYSDFVGKVIKFPDVCTMLLIPQYLSLPGQPENFSAIRIYLHEMLHILLNLRDPTLGAGSI
ncbi:hypothetical protein SK355_02010 [Candidatus Fukatsuia symbiotica]|uniref:Uncharacterized protein n=1 Tax=Candidatus Fukatsuia symbiotica TaxID=1878942 RepID=A0A2Y9CK94_9GAMM|nr:hypothetical protein [Candidatus Fukatsuia symbiotica]AWK13253.1 hypothetical protein CCS41_00080 [Candidatus Fukatsuia symbiotica]MEA9444118.1 hypothetical protein [Candidatus Fukatsuia symbiotica]